ncbi:metal tolerance protein 8 [Forsythia ovata]|uniref:Metal tolerance protein 8 n=1 Tax=Forsythia ovata TaxID=205694 RepID=A0ABD1UCN2_9LAMI
MGLGITLLFPSHFLFPKYKVLSHLHSFGVSLQNSAEILLQRVPRAYEQDLKEALNDVMKLKGVCGIQNLHAWSFTNTDVVGTYSTVFQARDLESGKIVALKKVRFDNFEPESVCFMAQEIMILRRLDHPNINKAFEEKETKQWVHPFMLYAEPEEQSTHQQLREVLALLDQYTRKFLVPH